MRRRDFSAALGGVAAGWPRAARAQQLAKPFRIAFFPLGSPSNAYDQSLVDAFRLGLRQAGLVENRDIALQTTWIGGNDPQAVIGTAIQNGADLLVPCGSSASAAAKHLTASIPIVFVSVGNPWDWDWSGICQIRVSTSPDSVTGLASSAPS
jgi:putative ABC transport system substrate-binding protein